MYGAGGLRPGFIDHVRSTGNCSPMFVYRWEHTAPVLERLRNHDGSPYEGITLDLVDPVTGGPVYKTMTFGFQLLRPGEKLLAVRQNANLIVTVYKGEGVSKVGEDIFHWSTFDTFCVPGGTWFEHHNTGAADAILFLSTDAPALRSLAYMLKQGRSPSGDVVTLESSNRPG
jgi:gentisate 1,2-dioxygenase